jgi:phosphatidylglycerol:prolipoprotein diacylglycerol transferase
MKIWTKVLFIFLVVLALLAIVVALYPAFKGIRHFDPYIIHKPLAVRWYGIMFAVSLVAGFVIGRNFARQRGILPRQFEDYAFWLIISSFVGARLYFVLTELKYFYEFPGKIIAVWNGGLSLFGALLTGTIFTYFWVKANKQNYKIYLDIAAISLPVSQAIGRLGNFFNQEAFGLPTDLPWRMHVEERFRPIGHADFEFFHPTFLYEALGLVLIAGVLYLFRQKVRPGVLAAIYLALYSLLRFFVEGLRMDSSMIGQFKLDQIVAFACFLASSTAIYLWQIKPGKPPSNV